jgi:hypothetical protein
LLESSAMRSCQALISAELGRTMYIPLTAEEPPSICSNSKNRQMIE